MMDDNDDKRHIATRDEKLEFMRAFVLAAVRAGKLSWSDSEEGLVRQARRSWDAIEEEAGKP